MALPEIATALSLFIISRFHGAVVASLLFPAELGAGCHSRGGLGSPMCCAPFTRSGGPAEDSTPPRGDAAWHFHGPISNLGVQLSSASQRRSIAAARSCMFRPRKEKCGLPCACEIGQGPPLGCFPRGDAGMARPGSAQRGDLGFARPLVSGSSITVCSMAIGLGAGWQGTSLEKCAEQPGEVRPSLDGLNYKGTWGTIDGERVGNGS